MNGLFASCSKRKFGHSYRKHSFYTNPKKSYELGYKNLK